jgi:hypothetical protein
MYSCTAEKELIGELRKAGYKYTNSDQIFRKKSLAPVETQLILKWLPRVYEQHLGAGDILVRSLISAKEPFDPSLLIELFEKSTLNSSIKSSIGHVIVHANTGNISKWVKTQLLNKDYAFERSSLVSGLTERGGFKNIDQLKQFLELIFEKYPISVLEMYDKIGDKYDIDFLLERIKLADKKLSKDIEKTLKKILKKEGIKK